MRYTILILLFSAILTADTPTARKPTEFYFARLQYKGFFGDDNIKNWHTDYPDMDNHLASVLNRVTGVHADVAIVPVTAAIYHYPFLYTVEPEQINLDDKQVLLMREWSARGGFWMADDFHGDEELLIFENTLRKIWPDIVRVELPLSHEVFHVFYDVGKILQAVNDSINSCRAEGCVQWENGPTGKEPKVFAYYTSGSDQIRVLAAWNNDLGDGLEWADDPNYPSEMSVFSFKIFANAVIYSLTH